MSFCHDDVISVCESLCVKLKKLFQDVLESRIYYPDRNLGTKGFSLEEQKEEIFNILSQFDSQLVNWKFTKNELESRQKMLQLKLHEFVLDANARRHCIEKFKETFSSQYVQIECLKLYNRKLESNLERIKKELHRSQISEKWLKDRLDMYRLNKSKSNKESVINAEILKQQIETIQNLNLNSGEIRKPLSNKVLNRSSSEILDEVHVKKTIDKEIQTIDYCGKDYGLKRSNNLSEETHIDDKKDFSNHHSHEFQCRSRDTNLNLLLEAKCSNVEKSLIANNSIIEAFKHFEKQLCGKLIASEELGKNKNIQISHLMKDIHVLQMNAFEKIREKQHLDGLAFKIYQQFIKLKSIQGQLKAVLKDKEQLISVLYTEKIKLIEDNNKYRNIEYHDKKTICELSEAVNILELQKQEEAAVHYDELFDYNNKFNIMNNQIMELRKYNEHLINETKHSQSLTYESLNEYKKKLHSTSEVQDIQDRDGVEECARLDGDPEINEKSSSSTNFEVIEPAKSTSLENQYSNLNLINDTLGSIETNTTPYVILLRDRFSKMSEKCRKISEKNSKIIKILATLKYLDVPHLIAAMNNMKILNVVKEREKVEQNKKFEKYVRILLNQVKKYKKSYLIAKEQHVNLKELFKSLSSELNCINRPLQEITVISNSSSYYPSIENTMLDDDIVDFDSGFASSSEIFQPNGTSVTDSIKSKYLMDESACFEIDRFGILRELQTQKIDEYENIDSTITILEADDSNKACDFDNIVVLKTCLINQLKGILTQKEHHNTTISNQLIESDKLLKEKRHEVNSLQKEINILNSQLQRNIITIDELKQKKLSLINCLKQRDELLRKIFVAFKQKLQKAVDEANDKFFLQRLCSDLKFAVKLYASQNKILRDVLQDGNGKRIFSIAGKSGEYISVLCDQREDYYSLKKNFVDIQSHIDSMKKQMSLLQAICTES